MHTLTLPSVVGTDVAQEMTLLASTLPPGALVEVGVYKGGTAQWLTRLASQQGRECWLFDTFTGIPFQGEHDPHRVGDFSDTDWKAVQDALPSAHVIKGVFPDSIGDTVIGPVAFAHLDCDQYQSIVESVNYLLPLMVEGGVIWFDDVNCLPGADKAVKDLGLWDKLRKAKCNKVYIEVRHDEVCTN
jgi:hypothetical protein